MLYIVICAILHQMKDRESKRGLWKLGLASATAFPTAILIPSSPWGDPTHIDQQPVTPEVILTTSCIPEQKGQEYKRWVSYFENNGNPFNIRITNGKQQDNIVSVNAVGQEITNVNAEILGGSKHVLLFAYKDGLVQVKTTSEGVEYSEECLQRDPE